MQRLFAQVPRIATLLTLAPAVLLALSLALGLVAAAGSCPPAPEGC